MCRSCEQIAKKSDFAPSWRTFYPNDPPHAATRWKQQALTYFLNWTARPSTSYCWCHLLIIGSSVWAPSHSRLAYGSAWPILSFWLVGSFFREGTCLLSPSDIRLFWLHFSLEFRVFLQNAEDWKEVSYPEQLWQASAKGESCQEDWIVTIWPQKHRQAQWSFRLERLCPSPSKILFLLTVPLLTISS